LFAKATAKFTATVDLPTPPLPEKTSKVFFILLAIITFFDLFELFVP
jgi:hypothetical protein